MTLELYFSPGACSFVPHVALEAAHAAFEPKIVKFHKGEQRTPEYLAMNPNGQVPVLVVDGRPLTQIVAICDFLDRTYPEAALLPSDGWARAKAFSQLAWMNNTIHPTATRFFFPERYAASEEARKEVRKRAIEEFRGHLERVQAAVAGAKPFWLGARIAPHDAYAFTLLRWGGFMGIDPASLPAYLAYAGRVTEAPPVAAALARERIGLDSYKPAG